MQMETINKDSELPLASAYCAYEDDSMLLVDPSITNSVNGLPDEIIEFILTYLPPYGDLSNCSLVCKRWKNIVKNLVRRSKLNLSKGLTDYRLHWEKFSQQTTTKRIHHSHSQVASTSSHARLNATAHVPVIAGRFSHSAVFYDNSMYIFGGGSSSDTTFNDLWRFDLTHMCWERPVSMGSYPSPKGSASMVQWRDQLVLFGGWRYPSLHPPYQPWCLFDELHYYDLANHRWNMCFLQPCPPPMAGHSATVHGDRMIVFGGYQISDGINSNSNETWCLELHTQKWWQPRIFGNIRPPPRYGQFQLILDEKHLLIVGGCGGANSVYSDAWVLDMTTESAWVWRTVEVRNKEFAASHMWCNPACQIDGKLVVLGPSPNMPQDFQMKNHQLPRLLGHGVNRLQGGAPLPLAAHYEPLGAANNQRGLIENNNGNGNGGRRDYFVFRRAILNMHQRQQQNGINNNNNNNIINNNNNQNNNNNINNNLFNNRNNYYNYNNNNNNHNNNNYNAGNINQILQPRTGRLSELRAAAIPAGVGVVPNEEAEQQQPQQNRPSLSNASTPPPNADVHDVSLAAEAAHRLQRNLALRCRENDPTLPKRFDELYEDPPRMAAFKEPASPRNQSKDHNERIRRLEEKMNAIRSRRNVHINEMKAIKEPSPKRVKRNVLSLFVCDLSAVMSPEDPHLQWMAYKNYGIIPGAPERLILSTMVAGHGELILFGGVHKETLSELTHQVSSTIHFLSAPRDIV